MAGNKTQPTSASVDDFLAGVPEAARREDCRAVAAMMQAATGEAPVMWGDNIVGFSPRKNDLTLYLMPGLDGREALLARLGKHRTGKACLYLKRLSDVDASVLRQLIDASVEAMAADRVA